MSDKTQNNEEIFVEDVEEENLVEDQELEQDTPEEVSEESQETLSDSILEVLLGEAKKKNEDEDEDEDEESDSEESDDEEEDEDEEDVAESKKKNEDDDDEDEDEESDSEESDDDEDDDEEVEVETVKPKTKAGILADAFSTIKSMKKHDLVKAYEAMQGDDDEDDDEDEIEENGEKKSTRPQTKAEMVNAMYKGLREMKKDDLVAAYNAITSSMQTEEVEREVEEAFATDLKVLVDADSNLTEDFKSKASALFEAAVANKIITIKEELENTYEEALQEEIVYVRDSLIEKNRQLPHICS